MDLNKVNALKQQRKAVLETNYRNAETDHYTLLQHDKDVIFYDKSLKEFIRLIQRQGINNLTIYSVGELLAGNKYETVLVRNRPANYEYPPQEFDLRELQDRKNYFVFVRYSFAWEEGFTDLLNDRGNPISKNEKNGRHVFVRTVNDILFYKKYNTPDNPSSGLNTDESSVFSEAYSEENPLPSVFPENADYMKNGTFTVTIDNVQYVIKIKGFNDDGEYEGIVKAKDGDIVNDDNIDKPFNPDGTGNAYTSEKGFFLRSDGVWANSIDNDLLPVQTNTYDLGSNSPTYAWRNLYLSNDATIGGTATTGVLLPKIAATNPTSATHEGIDIGGPNNRWDDVWAQYGNFNGGLILGGTANGGTTATLIINDRPISFNALPSNTDSTDHFWRGGSVPSWSNELTGQLRLTNTGTGSNSNYNHNGTSTRPTATNTLLYANGDGYFVGNIFASKVFNAVFNDYAECRTTIDLTPGHVVVDNDDGSLSCATTRLMPGAQVISDTYGNLMGQDERHQTPIAVAGRVLVYTYQPRENYHAGMAVCSAPNGTVDIMTREEIRDYPDCIVGIVSEIPQYERWGTDEIEVKGRIWIKVK